MFAVAVWPVVGAAQTSPVRAEPDWSSPVPEGSVLGRPATREGGVRAAPATTRVATPVAEPGIPAPRDLSTRNARAAAVAPAGPTTTQTQTVAVSHIDAATRRAVVLQIALERAGFSPGLIDGAPGPKTQMALEEFAAAHGLVASVGAAGGAAAVSPEVSESLRLADTPAFTTYRITAADLAQVSGPTPKTWLGKSQVAALGYENLTDLLAEKFHTSERFIARLNPTLALDALQPGDAIVAPAADAPRLARVARLVVDLDGKAIRGYDEYERQVLLLHCSIARIAAKRPSRDSAVAVIAEEPDYTFDPARWPEVTENISRKLRLPPGPRNPVGSTWIGLDLPGYGIHGTPTPELIGKTGSAGCLRLPNWDARRLAFAVRIGTPVVFQ